MRLTNAQIWFIHALEVLAGGGILTAVLTIYGAFHAGNFDLASASVAAGGALAAFLAHGYKGIITNAQAPQALADSIDQLTQAHNGFAQQLGHITGLVTGLLHLTSAVATTPPQVVQVPPIQPASALVQQPAPQWQTNVNPIPQRPQQPFPTFTVPQAAIGSVQQQPPPQQQ